MTNTVWPTIAQAISNASQTAAAPLTWDPTNHLLSRFAFGPTLGQRAWVAANGPDAWYSSQVTFAQSHKGYLGHPTVAAQGPLLSMNPYDTRQWLKDNDNEYGWDAMEQLGQVTLGLQAWSPGQLYETLVDFFSNHLNVPNHNGDLWNTRHCYDRDVIRKYALDSFTNMLLASAKHPAMLRYLSLADSTKTAVNENYGRELLELHTVGLNYAESDVKNAAKLLTGRTVNDNMHYLFDDYIHAVGAVQVLGFTSANAVAEGGEAAGDTYVRYLAAHPLTATMLARKLCIRFVSDAPSDQLVADVANAYLSNRTQILPMVSTILRSTEFWESRGLKVRRPTENLLATIRILGVTVTDMGKALDTLNWMTDSLGNRPLDWTAPNGYPDVARAWRGAGTLLNLWNMHLGFAGGWWDGMSKANIPALYASAPTTSGQAVDLLTRTVTGMAWTPAHRTAVQTFLNEPATTLMTRSVLQWLDAPMLALVLDSPHHALR